MLVLKSEKLNPKRGGEGGKGQGVFGKPTRNLHRCSRFAGEGMSQGTGKKSIRRRTTSKTEQSVHLTTEKGKRVSKSGGRIPAKDPESTPGGGVLHSKGGYVKKRGGGRSPGKLSLFKSPKNHSSYEKKEEKIEKRRDRKERKRNRVQKSDSVKKNKKRKPRP